LAVFFQALLDIVL